MKIFENVWFLKGCAIIGYTVAVSMGCDQCGKECKSACGTRHFRSCCFNYVRKRSSPPMRISSNHINDDLSKQQSPLNPSEFEVSKIL